MLLSRSSTSKTWRGHSWYDSRDDTYWDKNGKVLHPVTVPVHSGSARLKRIKQLSSFLIFLKRDHCLGDCAVDVHYHHENRLEVLLDNLPFVIGSHSKHLVLKEDVAGVIFALRASPRNMLIFHQSLCFQTLHILSLRSPADSEAEIAGGRRLQLCKAVA